MLFHKLGHIDPHNGIFGIKQKLGECFTQFSFTHTGRSHKQERSIGSAGISKAGSGASNGIGDNADLDDDEDGVPDTEDAFPLDSTETLDSDEDGVGNTADPDDDNDGLFDTTEINTIGTDPLLADTDGDGLSDGDEFFLPTDPLVAGALAKGRRA